MSKHFQIMDFLRRVRSNILREYFDRRGMLSDFNWGTAKRVNPDEVVLALKQEGNAVFDDVVADFHQVWDLHGPGFTRGILNEAKFHRNEEVYELLSGFTGLEKALWAKLNEPLWTANAKVLSDVDKLPPGAWIKRRALPLRGAPIDQSVVTRLEDDLVDYFTKTEHRGRSCQIDCLKQGDEEIFFTYAEDHPDVRDIWLDGKLVPQRLNDSFKLIFKHHDKNRTLDIHFDGNKDIIPRLQQIFAASVIGDEIPLEAPEDDEIYDLEILQEPGFRFEYRHELGISDVRVTKMRFVVEGEPWRRFVAEADNSKDTDALSEFVSKLSAHLPRSRLFLDQVCINVRFHKREGDRKARSRTFYITYPNSLRLKKDELGQNIESMLIQSGVERRSADHEG